MEGPGKSEDDFIKEFVESLSPYATAETFRILDEALRAYPESARLWCRRGMSILIADEGPTFTLSEALRSFETSASLDPTYSSAFEEMGYFHDVHTEDLARAEEAFRRAIELGAGIRSYEGLARVLAESRRIHDALTVLRKCPIELEQDGSDHRRVKELEREIQDGNWTPE